MNETKKLPLALIVDIDGTLAIRGDRSPFEWGKVGIDTVNEPVARVVRRYAFTHEIIIFSGREDVCEQETRKWLEDNKIPYNQLHMRGTRDVRKDSLVKFEMFVSFVKDQFEVDFVLDDRDQVVDMWRNELHLPCFQVNYGNF